MPATPMRLIELPTHTDPRGSITIAERGAQIDFEVHRARWIHGVPADARRGGHAHHETTQLYVALAGEVEVVADDGRTVQRVTLDAPHRALLVPPRVWVETERFSPGAILLLLSSTPFSERDYIRDRAAFRALVAGGGERDR